MLILQALIFLFLAIAVQVPLVASQIRSSRQCECNYRNVWLDLVFLFDSSKAVGGNDFLGITSFVSSFIQEIRISQQRGRYSRVAFVNVGNEARIIANLTSYDNSSSASAAVKRIPHLKSTKVNMFEGLSRAEAILQDKRKNAQSVIVLLTSTPVDCTYEYVTNTRLMQSATLKQVQDISSCRLASHLRQAGHIIMTIGLKLDASNYPVVDITSPCYSIHYEKDVAQQFTDLLCRANCFCLPPYLQHKNDSKCEEYGECLYFYAEKLVKSSSEDTCKGRNTSITEIFDESKEKFVRENHEYFSRTPYWVALSSIDGNETYRWASGKKLLRGDYTNWGPAQPNTKLGNCVVEDSGVWRSAECEDFLNGNYFSCEKNACDTENYCEYEPAIEPSVAPPVHSSRQCECNYRNSWLDLVFLFDSSNAVGENDFHGIKNFIGSFTQMIKISQQKGRYSRVAFVNVGNEATIIGDLKSYNDSRSALTAVRGIPHLKSTKVNMLEGLSKAGEILQDKRKNVQSVIVLLTSNPIDCSQEYMTRAKLVQKASLKEAPDVSSCRLAAQLRQAGHIIMTIGLKLDASNYPVVDITSPCYSINYDKDNTAQQFANLLCKANCFCLPPYIQNQDESKCEEYGECLYFYDEKLMKSFAEDTCRGRNTNITEIFDEAKEKFVREHHEYFDRTPYWIALSSVDGNGTYLWASGKQLLNGDYTNWGSAQPNPKLGNCVIEDSGVWRSAECDDFLSGHYFSCEKNACDTENYCEYGA